MHFLNLPNYIILQIANEQKPGDLNALLRTNRYLASLLKMPLIDCLFALRDETVGKRALYFAARRGDKPLVRLLLNRGVHTFVAAGAVLNEGVRWLDITVLRVLLECGIDPETRDKNGETPFSVACRYNRLDVVKLLLDDPRVNINSRDRTGRTGLSHAAGQGHVGVVTLLLTREAMD